MQTTQTFLFRLFSMPLDISNPRPTLLIRREKKQTEQNN